MATPRPGSRTSMSSGSTDAGAAAAAPPLVKPPAPVFQSTLDPLSKNFLGLGGWVYSMDLHAPSQRLATGAWRVRLWDVSDMKKPKHLHLLVHNVYSVRFTPDGRQLVSGGKDGSMMMWDVEDGAALWSNSVHTSGISCLRFVSPELLLSASQDGTVKLWSTKDFSRAANAPPLAVLQAPNKAAIQSLAAFYQETRLNVVAGLSTGSLCSWTQDIGVGVLLADAKFEPHSVNFKLTHGGAIYALEFNKNGTVVYSASADNTVAVWRVADATRIVDLKVHSAPVYALQLSADGRWLVSGSTDSSVAVFDTRQPDGVHFSGSHKMRSAVYSLALDSDKGSVFVGMYTWIDTWHWVR